MARRKGKSRGWRFSIVMAVVLGLALAAAWYWWTMRSWAPSEADYPDQGVALAPGQYQQRFETVSALGAKFAYFSLGAIGEQPDPSLSEAMAQARAAGLQTGAQLSFDPCAPADPQSARFVTMVARDPALLPPAIALGRDAANCDDPVSDAAVESELMTLINQIEGHAGKPVILKLSRGFEERFSIASKVNRDLWVLGDRFAPRYAGRPWLLWSANGTRHIVGADEPLEWVVVQP